MKKKKIVIMGAGISGLSLAWFLEQRLGNDIDIVLVEKKERAGSEIETQQECEFLFEKGPRGFRIETVSPIVLDLIKALKLDEEIIPSGPFAKKSGFFHQGQLQTFPTTVWEMLLFSWKGSFLKELWNEISMLPSEQEDESISSFFSRRFGPDFARILPCALTLGIFGGDSRKLSMRSCFPFLFHLEKKYGSLIRGIYREKRKATMIPAWLSDRIGKSFLFSFQKGMSSLVQRLANQLKSPILFSSLLSSIDFDEHGVNMTINGEQQRADHLIVTTQLSHLASCLPSHYVQMHHLLEKMQYETIATVHLGYYDSPIKEKGIGYVIPLQEKEMAFHVLFDSYQFPEHNFSEHQQRITVLLGEHQGDNLMAMSSAELLQAATKSIKKQIGIEKQPCYASVNLSPLSLPQYCVGHTQWTQSVKLEMRRLSPRVEILSRDLFGLTVNDCIVHAKKTSEELALQLYSSSRSKERSVER